MAKGFGGQQKGHLGYVLILLPEVKAYAADFSMGRDDDQFIGITSSLEMAQVWKKKSEARQDVFQHYLAFLFEQLDDQSDQYSIEIRLRKLSRLSNGKLKEEPEEDWVFELVESEDE